MLSYPPVLRSLGHQPTQDARVLQASLAFVWFATGALVLHPMYRAFGEAALDKLGLPPLLMWLTCAAEVALALVLLLAPPRALFAWAQIAAVATFSLILALSQPMLLASPWGMLTKNLPFVAVAWTTMRLATEGWSPRVERVLAWGCAIVWLTEGVVPKLLLQQPDELAVVAASGMSFGRPDVLLRVLGAAQAVSFALALWAPKPLRAWVLAAQAFGLVVLPLWVGSLAPWLVVHPFGPLTKNVPLLAGTVMLWRRCSTSR